MTWSSLLTDGNTDQTEQKRDIFCHKLSLDFQESDSGKKFLMRLENKLKKFRSVVHQSW